jgi:hypothetical protein
VASFGQVIQKASKEFLERKPLATKGTLTEHAGGINDWINEYITFVVSRCIVGPVGYDNEDLIKTFLKFNDDAVAAMGLSSMLPHFLQFLASFSIKKDFETVRKVTLPIIAKRRNLAIGDKQEPVFLDYIIQAVDDDKRAAGKSRVPQLKTLRCSGLTHSCRPHRYRCLGRTCQPSIHVLFDPPRHH